jgi:hypothetical protein
VENESKYEPPRRNFKGLPFLLGALGLFLLAGAVDMLRARRSLILGGTLTTAALVLIILAVLRARRQD